MRKLFNICLLAVLAGSIYGCGKPTNKAAIDAFNNGQKAFENKDFDSAVTDFTKAIELDPKFVNAYSCRGDGYLKLKAYLESIADCTKAMEVDPKHANAYIIRGNAYRILKKYPESMGDCTKAIELDPKHANAYNIRGMAYADLNKYAEAITDFSKAIATSMYFRSS